MTTIDIILGCMFSGKSTELIRRINRFKSIGKTVVCINHKIDIRSPKDVIKTHENDVLPALKTDKLMNIIFYPEFVNAEVVAIDEAQFFDDLLEFVKYAEKYNKSIIIAGLDGDYQRKPMGQILECIPLCDSVIKLKAYDMIDRDGSSGIFTKRITEDEGQVVVGDKDKYMAVSRKNYKI